MLKYTKEHRRRRQQHRHERRQQQRNNQLEEEETHQEQPEEKQPKTLSRSKSLSIVTKAAKVRNALSRPSSSFRPTPPVSPKISSPGVPRPNNKSTHTPLGPSTRDELDWLVERVERARQKKKLRQKQSRNTRTSGQLIAKSLNDMGNVFFRRGQYDRAMDAYLGALSEEPPETDNEEEDDDDDDDINDEDIEDESLVGATRVSKSKKTALAKKQALNRSFRLARIAALHNIGIIRYLRGDRSKALRSFKEAMEYSRPLHQPSFVISKGGKRTSAEADYDDHYDQSVSNKKKKKYRCPVDIPGTIKNICNIHVRRGELEEAAVLRIEAKRLGLIE